MSALDTNMPASQLNPMGMGGLSGVNGPMNAYIGPSMTPGTTSAYQKRRFHTQNLPDAYANRALLIRNSTEEITWLGQQRWQTSTVMPLQIVDDLVLHVEHFEAHPTFFSVTPEQAVAHMVTQSASQEEVRLVRWSLQARLEHGFMGTAMGQQRYAAMLNQFSTSMNETANAEVARALLEATDPQQTWLQRHGQMQIDDLHNYLRWDLFVFGALQKIAHNPLEKINQKVISMMTAYSGRADTFIMSEDLEIYANLVPLRKTVYSQGGQEAVNRVNGIGPGVDRNTPSIFNTMDPVRWLGECAIYIHRSFVVEGQGDIDPWHRTRQIGEWNILEDTVRDVSKYTTDRRTIFVYNQDRDTMSRVQLRDAVLYCQMWNEDGTLRDIGVDGNVDPRYNRDARFFPFAVESNSFRPIKFIGDLSSRHFDTNDLGRAAATMINSAYRDNAQLRSTQTGRVESLLNEARIRLMGGTRENAGQVKLDQMRLTHREEVTAFENFANRMRAIAPNCIFLEPSNGSLSSDKSPAQTLWESTVLAGAVPYFDVDGTGVVAADIKKLALRGLLRALRSMIKRDATVAQQQFDTIVGGEEYGDDEAKMQAVVEYLTENPEYSIKGAAELNSFVRLTVAQYRQRVAEMQSQPVEERKGRVAADEVSRVAGYLNPGAPLPGDEYAFGSLDQGYAAWPAGGVAAMPRVSRQSTQAEGEDRDMPLVTGARGNATRSASMENLVTPIVLTEMGVFPVNAGMIPMFQNIANIAAGRGRSGAGRRRADVYDDFDSSLGSVAAPIGSYMDDERFFADRDRELGHTSALARELGIDTLDKMELDAMIGPLSSNMAALAASGMPEFHKVMAFIYLGLPFKRQTLISLCDNNIVVPVTALFVRPHITVEGRIIVKCLSGGGSGFTYYAHANVMVGDNVLTKTHTINMHFYLRAHVHKPRNVFIIPDVFIMGYHGGMGMTPITSPEMYNPAEMVVGGPCAFFFLCSYKTTRETVPNPFDISGHFNSRYRIRGAPSQGPPAYDSAAYYAALMGFGGNNGNVDLPALYENHVNGLVYRGHQEEDDGHGGYTKIEPNTGHWGHKVYKGCKAAREGELYVLQEVAYGRGVFKSS